MKILKKSILLGLLISLGAVAVKAYTNWWVGGVSFQAYDLSDGDGWKYGVQYTAYNSNAYPVYVTMSMTGSNIRYEEANGAYVGPYQSANVGYAVASNYGYAWSVSPSSRVKW